MANEKNKAKRSKVNFEDRIVQWNAVLQADDLVMIIFKELAELQKYLTQTVTKISEKYFPLLVKALGSACYSSDHENEIVEILKVLCDSPFLTQYITLYTTSIYGTQDWQRNQEIILSIGDILDAILSHLPNFSSKVYIAVTGLSVVVKEFDVQSDRDRLINLLTGLERRAQFQHKSGERVDSPHKTLTIYTDNDVPPEDFITIPAIPTDSDFLPNTKPFVRKPKVKEPYKSVPHYLDVQFRLMRLDFIMPLKNGISELRAKKGVFQKFRCSDIRIYYILHIEPTDITSGYFQLNFDLQRCKRVDWENTDRLMIGSLICLSANGFNTFAVATVRHTKGENLKQGILNIHVKGGLEHLFEAPSNELVMAESVAFFDPYFHVLESLKAKTKSFPLQNVLILCEPVLKPPAYLRPDSKFPRIPIYNLSSLTLQECDVNVQFLVYDRWPDESKMCLNESQKRAAMLALTKEVAVIQGPPGTGKTYVGLKVVETLLKNKKVEFKTSGLSFDSPILVVCYTNHALDQFLDGIVTFCPNSITRIGEGCKSKKLTKFILKNPLQRFATNSLKTVNYIKKRITQFNNTLQLINKDIMSTDELKSFMIEDHKCFFQASEYDLKTWLFSAKNTIEKDLTKLALDHLKKLVPLWAYTSGNFKLGENLDICERCSLYYDKIEQVRKTVQTKKYQARRNKQSEEEKEMTEVLTQTYSEILPDDLIDKFCPKSFSDEIKKKCMSNVNHKFLVDNKVIQFWLLGQDRPVKTLINDIEILTSQLLEDPLYQQDNELKTKVKELKSAQLELSLTKLCDVPKSKDGWKVVDTSSRFQHVMKAMSGTEPMTDKEEKAVEMTDLNLQGRFSLYLLWIKKYREQLNEIILTTTQQLKFEEKKAQDLNNEMSVAHLKSSQIIGMTTTDAAKYKDILDKVGCNIVIVEEAAEVLESHIVTALSKNCQHLILIGDHLQLRPKPATYELEKRFNLDVSLFERLIQSQIPHVTLRIQHRMRPEISQMIKLIYPELEDHPSVCQFEHIRGVSKDVFFINHSYHEVSDADSFSKSNEHEAKYVAALCEYFTKHDYLPSQITIITTYKGQVSLIRKYMKNPQPRISAVDDFQGEENEIIILSLVRSNEENIAGFVKIDNRICVALSRAKKGLFVIGNFNVLTSKSKLWKQIIDIAKKQSIFDLGLPVQCSNHQDGNQVLKTAEDFLQRPEGGCGRPCKSLLECGHHCQLQCHWYDLKHESYVCERPCGRKCQLGHPCQMLCYEPCLCQHVVKKFLKECGHSIQLPCHKFQKSSDCTEQCGKTLPCGHRCDGQCKCCMRQGSHVDCKVKVDYVVQSCGHKVQISCFQSQTNVLCEVLRPAKLSCGHLQQIPCHVTPENAKCSEKCSKKLPCEHPCEGQCSDCVTNGSHKECQVLVDHIYSPCEHKGQVPCFQSSASVLCPHDCTSTLQCGHLCTGKCRDCVGKQKHKDCLTPIDYTYKQCGHSGQVPCYKSSSDVDCNQPCPSKLKCGHQCKGTCSGCLYGLVHKACQETCNQLLPCGHVCTGFCSSPCLPCTQTCSYSCRHTSCATKSKQNFCGQPCPPCNAKCMQKCVHLVNLRYCSEPWENVVCTELCTKRLKVYHPGKHGSEGKTCSHTCGGFCGEICVCSLCEKVVCLENVDTTTLISTLNAKVAKSLNDDTKSSKGPIIKLPNCGHIFYAKELDKYVAKHNQVDVSSYIYCPICPKPILKCLRYDQLNWRRFQEREKRKLDLLQRNTISLEHESSIQRSISILTALNDFELYEEQLENVGNILSEEDFRSISLKIKFIYAISLIGLGQKECEEECRRTSMLKFVLESARFSQQTELELHEELVRCLRLNALKALEKFFSGKDFGDTRHSIEEIKNCLVKTPAEPDILKMAHELIMALFDVPDERVKSLPAEYQQIRDKVLNIEKVLRSRTFETLADVLYPKKISLSKSNFSATHQDYFSKLFGNIEDPCAISKVLTDAGSNKEDDRPSDFRSRRSSIERNKTEKTKDETSSVKNETLRDRRVSRERENVKLEHQDVADVSMSRNQQTNESDPLNWRDTLMLHERDRSDRPNWRQLREIDYERQSWRHVREDSNDRKNWRKDAKEDDSDRKNWRKDAREDDSDRKNWRKGAREDDSDRKNWRKGAREDDSDRKNWRDNVK